MKPFVKITVPTNVSLLKYVFTKPDKNYSKLFVSKKAWSNKHENTNESWTKVVFQESCKYIVV